MIVTSRSIKNLPEIQLVTTTGTILRDSETRKPLTLNMVKVLQQFAGDPSFTAGVASFAEAAKIVHEFLRSFRFASDQIVIQESDYRRLLNVIRSPGGRIESSTMGCYWPFIEAILLAEAQGEEQPQAAE